MQHFTERRSGCRGNRRRGGEGNEVFLATVLVRLEVLQAGFEHRGQWVQATIVPWHHRHDRPKVATAPERSYLKDRRALNAISDLEADGPPPRPLRGASIEAMEGTAP